MEKILTEKQLTDYSKETIVTMYMALQEITESLKEKQCHAAGADECP